MTDLKNNEVYSPIMVNVSVPNNEVLISALRKNGYLIRHTTNPDKDLQLTAIHQEAGLFNLLKILTEMFN